MLRKLYVDNFRCLVNFTMEFGSFAILCGPNGAGKSSVFDALKMIKELASGEAVLAGEGLKDIPRLELNSWSNSRILEIGVELEIEDSLFEYSLQIEQVTDSHKPRITSERAIRQGRELYRRDLDGVSFTNQQGERKSFPLDWRQAALGAIEAGGVAKDLKPLQDAFKSLLILRPNPRDMETESRAEVVQPDLFMRQLTSWYRFLFQEQEWSDSLRDSLRDVWPDFMSFRLESLGREAKALQLRFGSEGPGQEALLYFDQLSDGEKALVGLYMVRAALDTGAVTTILIDEPDNYVGLPELQPWILETVSLLGKDRQAILISHHPEILASAGAGYGHYLWRPHHLSPTRIGPLVIPDGLAIGEAVARGWVNVD
jgi:energy-coupling factor transporter ATP-binding protein EcfA2